MERVTVRTGIGIDGGGIFTKVCVGVCLREISVRNTQPAVGVSSISFSFFSPKSHENVIDVSETTFALIHVGETMGFVNYTTCTSFFFHAPFLKATEKKSRD